MNISELSDVDKCSMHIFTAVAGPAEAGGKCCAIYDKIPARYIQSQI